MEQAYKYDAFISYRHLVPDKPIAERLQKLLETYVPPKELYNGQKQQNLRLFRDESELPSSNNLGNDIRTALEQSRFLIIVYSNHYEESKWCMQELEYFKSLHNGKTDQILMLWVGDPGSSPTIPEQLRFETKTIFNGDGTEITQQEEIEPLAANVSAASLQQSLKKLKTEFLRLAAPLFGCSYNDLFQREQRRQKKRMRIVLAAIISGLLVIALSSTAALVTISSQKREIENSNLVLQTQKLQIEDDNRALQISQSKLLLKEAKELEKSGDVYGALEAIAEALPGDGRDIPILNNVVECAANLSGAFVPKLFTATTKIDLPAEVKDICLFNEGKRLVTVDDYNSYLWDTETGDCIKVFAGYGQQGTAFFIDREINELSGDFTGLVSSKRSGGQNVIIGWEKRIGKEVLSYGNALYLCGSERPEETTVQRISPDDGTDLWSVEFEGSVRLETVSAEGVIIADSERIVVLSPETGNEIGEIKKAEIGEQYSSLPEYTYCKDTLIITAAGLSDQCHFAVYQKESKRFSLLFEQEFDCDGGGKFVCSLDDTTIYFIGEQFSDIMFVTPVVKAFDLQDGSLKWSLEGNSSFGGKIFSGLFKDLKGEEDSKNYLFVVIGEQILLISSDSGEIKNSATFEDVFQEMYYSKNGLVFLINTNGDELFTSVLLFENEDEDDYSLFFNHEFKGEVSLAAYCSNRYAVVLKDKKSVSIFQTVDNKYKSTVFMLEDEDAQIMGISDLILSPGKRYLAVCQRDPDRIFILDAKTNQLLNTIEEDGVRDCVFFGEYRLILVKYDTMLIVDCTTGKVVKEVPNTRTFDMNSEKQEMVFKSEDTLVLLDEDLEETSLFEVQEDHIDELIRTRSVSSFSSSPSFNQFLICFLGVRNSQSTVSSYVYSIYDKTTNSFVDLETEDLSRIKNCVWTPDEMKIYILSETDTLYNELTCYETQTGSRIFEQQVGKDIVSLLMIKDELCIQDTSGKIETVRYDGNTLLTEKTIDLGQQQDPLYVEILPDGLYAILSGPRNAWVLDLETFEIVYSIENYCGILPESNAVLTKYYNIIYAYPLPSPDDIIDRLDELMRS